MTAKGRLSSSCRAALLACLLGFAAGAGAPVLAQEPAKEKSNLFAGFGSQSDDPYEILADELEVFDAEKMAILTGNVSVRQGTSLLKAPYLKIFYADSGAGGSAAESQGIRRIEARGGVYVESGTQVAEGDEADYDAETEEMVMTGNVVLTDEGNVVKGDRLFVNLRTGESKVTAPTTNRIKLIITPKSGGEKK